MTDHLITCDKSGFVCKISEARLQWNGMLVRKDFWEARHPQDFLPTPRPSVAPTEVRLDQNDPELDSGNLYYDYYLDYDSILTYEVSPTFDLSMII
jgi:hypothetical protein